MGAGVAAILAMLLRSGDEDVLAAISAGSEAAAPRAPRETRLRRRRRWRRARRATVSPRRPCVAYTSRSKRANTRRPWWLGRMSFARLCYASVRRLLRRLNNAAPSQPVMRAISAALGGRDKTNVGGEGSGLFADEDGGRVRGFSRTRTRASIAVRRPPLHDFGVESRVARHVSAPPSAGPSSESRCQGEWDDLEGNRGLELRDHAASDFLVQPGLVIHLRHLSSEDGPTAEARHPTAFTEIPISTRMMTDHVPMVYQSAIDAVIAKREAEEAAAAEEAARRAEEVAVYGPGDTPRTSRRRRRWRRRRRREERREEMREERRTHRRRNASGRTKRRGVGAGARERDDASRARRGTTTIPVEGYGPTSVDRSASASASTTTVPNLRRVVVVAVVAGTIRRTRLRRTTSSPDWRELFGLDDDGEDDERDADGDGEFPGDGDGDGDGSSWDGSSSAPSTPRASPRARDGIARAPSWGLGRLGALIGKIRKDTEGLFAGAPDAGAGDAASRDANEKIEPGGTESGGAESGGAESGGAEGRAPARRRQTRIRWRRRRRRRGRASTARHASPRRRAILPSPRARALEG